MYRKTQNVSCLSQKDMKIEEKKKKNRGNAECSKPPIYLVIPSKGCSMCGRKERLQVLHSLQGKEHQNLGMRSISNDSVQKL